MSEARLYAVLAEYDSILVAYSGGVDSAYLAWAANRARPGQVLCVTADSPSYPAAPRHREAIARQFHCRRVRATSELERPSTAPTVQPLHHCKTELYDIWRSCPRPRLPRHRRRQQRRTTGATTGQAAGPGVRVRSPLDEAD